MKRRQRHNGWWLGLQVIFACLLATNMLVVAAPSGSYASGTHAGTGIRPSLYQDQQGPELCALLKQVAGSESLNLSGGGLPSYDACSAVSLESSTKAKFSEISVEREDSADTARSLVVQKGSGGCKPAGWGDVGYECSHTGELVFARACYVGGVLVNDHNPDASRGIAGALAAALPGSCGGGQAAPTPTTAPAAPANPNVTMRVIIGTDRVDSENDIWGYGKSGNVQVNVFPWDFAADKNATLDPATFHPVQVKLFYDGKQIGSGQTDATLQAAHFNFTPPDDTPQGLSGHEFVAEASKPGFDTVQAALDFQVARGLQDTIVSVDGIEGVHRPDDFITIKGQVWAADKSGSFTSPVAADIAVLGAGSSATGTSDTSGYFSIDFAMNVSQGTIGSNGVVNIDVYATPNDKNRFYNGHGYVSVRISAKGTLSITAGTNKGVYGPDENVTLGGQVTADGNPVAANVDVVVNGSVLLTNVQTDGSGQFRYAFLPSSVPTSPQNSSQIPPNQRNPQPGNQPKPNPIIPLKFSSTYVVTVTPHATGYLTGPDGAAYFTIAVPGDKCQAQEMQVSQIEGTALAQLNSAQFLEINRSPFSYLQPGMGVSQNMQVLTTGGRATLTLPLDGDKRALLALNGDTTVQIGSYCRDSSGKVHIVLAVSNPGQLLVQWPPDANADIKIVTPSGNVSSVHTRYFINVDKDGTTSLTGLEGTARLTDAQGATVDVDAGKQVTVAAGQSVGGLTPVGAQGQVDPRLVAILTANPANSTTGGSNSSSPPATGPSSVTPYIPWLVAAGAGILLLALLLVFMLARMRSRRPALSAVGPSMTVPVPVPPPDPFAAVEAQYRYMLAEMAAGRMTHQQRDAALTSMTVRDAYGRTWMLEGNDGQWLVYNGREWLRADPRQSG